MGHLVHVDDPMIMRFGGMSLAGNTRVAIFCDPLDPSQTPHIYPTNGMLEILAERFEVGTLVRFQGAMTNSGERIVLNAMPVASAYEWQFYHQVPEQVGTLPPPELPWEFREDPLPEWSQTSPTPKYPKNRGPGCG